MDRVSDRPKGFGFVTFASEAEAQRALTELNGKVNYCFSLSQLPLLVCYLWEERIKWMKSNGWLVAGTERA